MGKDQTVPYGTASRLNLFQAINCLATIIQSLRDKVPQTPLRASNRCESRSKDDQSLIPRISWIFFQAAFRLLSYTSMLAWPPLVK
jgi:hypothetical protein